MSSYAVDAYAEGAASRWADAVALATAATVLATDADAAASIAAYITLYTGTAEHIWQTDLLARMLDP